LLNDIIRYRLEETMKLVVSALPEDALEKVGSGVFLTGGASLIKGFGELADQVFNLPVYRPEQPDISGVHAYFRDPQYSTAVGLIRYAQLVDEERRASAKPGLLGKLGKMFNKK